MKLKTRQLRATLLLATLAAVAAGCSTGPARTTRGSEDQPAQGEMEHARSQTPARSSTWAGVLPSDAVNNQPLAMAEYNNEYARNDASLGVAQGPPGEVLSYYQTAPRPSLEWQYRFTLSTSPDTVTVFRRGDYGGYRRYQSDSYRNPAYGGYRRDR
ncbi:MAG: hypothetical protein K2Y21_11675 [Phycisphaerales bacterium]|nr:hypothetical protein [Phycisphaerales bacterium]